MWSPIPGTQPQTLYYVDTTRNAVRYVRAWPTDHPMIYMVDAVFQAVLNYDLFFHEEDAVRAGLKLLAQEQQDTTIAIENLKKRLKEIGEELIGGKAKGSEVREGPDTALGMQEVRE